jgi:hypothetical protein
MHPEDFVYKDGQHSGLNDLFKNISKDSFG